MLHNRIVSSLDPEAIAVKSAEMETDQTRSEWPKKVLTIPPVCVSQSLTVLSKLPDTSEVPSDEKTTHLTYSVCPERTVDWLPVIELRTIMSPDSDPAAMLLPKCDMVDMGLLNRVVREHTPHSTGCPLTTFSIGGASTI